MARKRKINGWGLGVQLVGGSAMIAGIVAFGFNFPWFKHQDMPDNAGKVETADTETTTPVPYTPKITILNTAKPATVVNTAREAAQCILGVKKGPLHLASFYNRCTEPLVVQVCEAKVDDDSFGIAPRCKTSTYGPGALIASFIGPGQADAPTDAIGFRTCIAPQQISMDARGGYVCVGPM